MTMIIWEKLWVKNNNILLMILSHINNKIRINNSSIKIIVITNLICHKTISLNICNSRILTINNICNLTMAHNLWCMYLNHIWCKCIILNYPIKCECKISKNSSNKYKIMSTIYCKVIFNNNNKYNNLTNTSNKNHCQNNHKI